MKTKTSYLLIIILFFSVFLIFAHGDKHKKKTDTVTVVNGDTIAVNGVMVSDTLTLAKQTVKLVNNKVAENFELTISNILFEHIHNKIIHFPIVLIVMAFFFSLAQFKYQKFNPTIKIMVLLAVLFSVVAFFTGTNQKEFFENTAKDWLVLLHRTFGITTLVITVVWSLFLFVSKLKKYAWLIAVLAFLIVSVTGFLGGVLAH